MGKGMMGDRIKRVGRALVGRQCAELGPLF